MKNLIIVFLVCAIIFSCQNQNQSKNEAPKNVLTSTFDENKEFEKIMKVIENETDCFYRRDYDCWKKNWVNEKYAFQAWTNSDGTYNAKVGWQAIDRKIGNYIQENPIKEGDVPKRDVRRKDLQVKFYGENLAYLIWEQFNQTRDGKSYQVSQEIRLMEKLDNDWKIVNISSFWDYKKIIAKDNLKI